MNQRCLVVLTGLATVLVMAATSAAEIKDATARGFTLENVIQVPVQPMEAWKALVDEVDRWWPKDHTWWGAESVLSIDARAGGCFCERNGEQQAQHLQVMLADPGRLLRLSGGLGPLQGMGLGGVLELRLAPAEGGGTTITMYYRAGGYTPDDLSDLAPVVDHVQALQLGGLASLLGGGPVEPQAPRPGESDLTRPARPGERVPPGRPRGPGAPATGRDRPRG